jgi:SRSO17 transposase
VLAVARSHHLATAAGALGAGRALAARLPPRAWQRLSAGAGAKGHRYYDWAWISTGPGLPGHRHLLIRRNRSTRELACYRCYSAHWTPLAALVRTAGRRWTVEEDFQAGKGLVGFGEHQVRTWCSWHRWVTLAMLALAFLTIAALAVRSH